MVQNYKVSTSMKGTVVDISGRECRLYKDSNAEFLLVQPIDEHDLEVLDQEVEIIKSDYPQYSPKDIILNTLSY